MDKNTRTFVNVLAQYVRTIINICLSLYSTRLVLQALGKSDYGLFMLVGGVVAMLSFLTNAMVITTQRHLSFYYGKGDKKIVKSFFANSLVLHFGLGALIAVILFALWPWLVNDILNIEPDRVDVAGDVYVCTLITLFISFMVAPFRGLFIAKENIVFISIVDVCDGVLKLIFVLMLITWDVDKLQVYAMLLTLIMFLNFFAFTIYGKIKYDECVLWPKRKDIKWSFMSRMFSFAGWTTYSTACIIGRNQGVAVVLNSFFGTIINSAYGIAMQVGGAVQFVSQSILNAMSPRVIKAEGSGDRQLMFQLAGVTSKFTFLMLSMIAVPLIFEMKSVLNFWLGEKDVPEYAVMFCRCILIAALCDQLTIGLGTANQAIGKIRNYSLLVNTTKAITIPVVWFCLHIGLSVVSTVIGYVTVECVCVLLRLIYMRNTAKLSVVDYSKRVFQKVVIPTICLLIVGFICLNLPDMKFRFLITIGLSVLVDAIVVFFFALEKNERNVVLNFMRKCYAKKVI